MSPPTKKKTTIAGMKRKAESTRGSSSQSIKKSKTNTAQSKVLTSQPDMQLEDPEDDPSETESNNSNDDGGAELVDINTSESDSEPPVKKGKDAAHTNRFSSGAGLTGTSSKEAHAKQKQLVAERRASKPLAEQLARTKKIWERLRRKSHVPLEERKTLIAELFEIITGNMKDYVLKHDSVRVVQTAVKYANLDQKRLIARELKGTYRQLAESKYAKFLIGKLLVHGDDEIRDLIVPEFFGNVRRLIKHPEASWILDDVYRGVATKQQKATILREWYGAEFALFRNDGDDNASGDLAVILAKDAAKRAPIMRSLLELINHLIQKKTTGFTMLHDAMLQYFLNAKPGTEEITDYIELIRGDEEGDLLKNLAFTKSGSWVVCLALAHSTAKDRRQILKGYKDTIQLMASDANAHIVILAAYDVIDDTVLTSKSIFSELLGKDAREQAENIIQLANNMVGRTTLLYLFQGRSNSLFPSNLSQEITFLSEIDSIRATTSKKDPNTRRKELTKAISPPLISAITTYSAELVTTPFGCQFIVAVLFGADGDKSEALKAVASTAAGDPSTQITAPEVLTAGDINTHEVPDAHVHIAHSPSAGKMLKSLIVGGPYDRDLKKIVTASPPLNFADILYPVIKEHLVAWATGPSSYVILRMFEAEDFGYKEEAMKALRQERAALVRASEEETPEKIAAAAQTEANGGMDVRGKGKKGKKGIPKGIEVGNKGTKLLLELFIES